MSGNTFGHIFRLTTFGESHGVAIGGVIDGCPAGLPELSPGRQIGTVRISFCGKVDPIRRYLVGQFSISRFPWPVQFFQIIENIRIFTLIDISSY